MAITLVIVAAVEADVAAAPRTAPDEMAEARPAGAAWTALAERKAASEAAPGAKPRLERNACSRSSARLTLF